MFFPMIMETLEILRYFGDTLRSNKEFFKLWRYFDHGNLRILCSFQAMITPAAPAKKTSTEGHGNVWGDLNFW